MTIEILREDGSWIECPWDTFEDFERFTEDYEDIYIIDRWRDEDYSYIAVHWMDEDTAKYRQSLLPDTSAIHGIDYSKNEAFKNLDFSKLAEAIVEALKEHHCSFNKADVQKTTVERLNDFGNWEYTTWADFKDLKENCAPLHMWSQRGDYVISVYSYNTQKINVYRLVSRAD